MRFTDPNGEFWQYVIGAVAGGIINWGIHGFQFNKDGLVAFGIGAAAGGIGAATFGAGLAAMGVAGAGMTSLGAVGAGGFIAGVGAGAFSYMAATPVLTVGNHIAFGDPLLTPAEYLKGLAFSSLTAGAMQGLSAVSQGNNFLDGNIKESNIIFNAQVESIYEGSRAPMPASSNMDDVLMERIGNRQVNSLLDERVAIYRNIGFNEFESLKNNGGKFTIHPNAYNGKQFWLDESALEWWRNTKFAKPIDVKLTIPKSYITPNHKNFIGLERNLIIDTKPGITITPTNLNKFNSGFKHKN